MYKKVTAGNIQDLQKKMNGRYDCHIYIKLTVDMQINKMNKEDYNDLVDQLRAQNITLILENKDGKLKSVLEGLSDEELDDFGLWIGNEGKVQTITIDNEGIVLIAELIVRKGIHEENNDGGQENGS